MTVDPSGKSTGGLNNALVFGSTEPTLGVCSGTAVGQLHGCTFAGPTGEGISSARTGPKIAGEPPKTYPNQYGLDFYAASLPRMSITHDGLIGIGTQKPASLLDLQHSGDVDLGLASSDGAGRRWILRSGGQEAAGAFEVIDGATAKPRLTIDSTGTVSVTTLKITGGADLSEPFNVNGKLAAGSVVVIDPAHEGRLKLSSQAYDTRVAGIVSGAGLVRPGVMLQQLGTAEDDQQIALSGRVYVIADTTGGAIEPGDFLTTSALAGQAMKAADPQKARGAIIGKAMSSLSASSGLVLVLVNLQ